MSSKPDDDPTLRAWAKRKKELEAKSSSPDEQRRSGHDQPSLIGRASPRLPYDENRETHSSHDEEPPKRTASGGSHKSSHSPSRSRSPDHHRHRRGSSADINLPPVPERQLPPLAQERSFASSRSRSGRMKREQSSPDNRSASKRSTPSHLHTRQRSQSIESETQWLLAHRSRPKKSKKPSRSNTVLDASNNSNNNNNNTNNDSSESLGTSSRRRKQKHTTSNSSSSNSTTVAELYESGHIPRAKSSERLQSLEKDARHRANSDSSDVELQTASAPEATAAGFDKHEFLAKFLRNRPAAVPIHLLGSSPRDTSDTREKDNSSPRALDLSGRLPGATAIRSASAKARMQHREYTTVSSLARPASPGIVHHSTSSSSPRSPLKRTTAADVDRGSSSSSTSTSSNSKNHSSSSSSNNNGVARRLAFPDRPDAAAAAGGGRKTRRLRNVTYVRTAKITAPIVKILTSRSYTIDIPRYQRLMGDEVVYVIQITSLGGADIGAPGWNWQVRHKYTAFANLHVILKRLRIVKDMPKFPAKRNFFLAGSSLLEKRRVKLAEYLNALARSDIGECQTFVDFLRPTMAGAYNAPSPTSTVRPALNRSSHNQHLVVPPSSAEPAAAVATASSAPPLPSAPAPTSAAPKKPRGAAPKPKTKRRKKKSHAAPPPLPPDDVRASSTDFSVLEPDVAPPVPADDERPATPPALSDSEEEEEEEEDDDDGDATATGRADDSLRRVSSSSTADTATLDDAREAAKQLRRSAVERPESLSLDDFEMLSLIGVGGFGKVFLCRKRSTSEILALKRMRKKLIAEKGQSAHVRTEQEVLEFTKALGDDCWLTRLFYSFETPEYLCLAMEYVPGGDLRIILDDFGCLDDDHARFYFCEMIMCVQSLHKLGYIHRDLKPANFLIDGDGHLKLGDFGLSKGAEPTAASSRASVVLSRRMKAYSVVGTPQYMAKETLMGDGYDASVDWWALGCILYEMIVGETPFSGDSAEDIFEAIRGLEHRFNMSAAPEDDEEVEDGQLSSGAREVVYELICDTSVRLGDGQVEQIQSLKWFADVDWPNLRSQEAPFIPQLESEFDDTYFAGATSRTNNDPDASLDFGSGQ